MESGNEKIEISLKQREDWIKIIISQFLIPNSLLSIVRAGELLHGTADPSPARGWYSPTYGVKVPALSFALKVTASDEVQFTTEFNLQP